MTDTMMPVIRQMLDADGDAVRAGILLSTPVAVLLRYREQFERACRLGRFDEGGEYLALLRIAQDSVRHDGLLPAPLAAEMERARQDLVMISQVAGI